LRGQTSDFTLESFELVPELKEYFTLWLRGHALNNDIQEVYDQVLKHVLKDSDVEAQKLKDFLWQKLESRDLTLQGPLDSHSVFRVRAHCLLFDAFSAKTSPELWTEEFLVEFFNKATENDAMVSTYASRTTLKKALKTAEFFVEVREGFQGKRNSTLAFKGLFRNRLELLHIFDDGGLGFTRKT
jgi:tRNA U34 5-methylaminomethyl-2-thiouridine-forming methyltransferase MnmC